MTRRPECPTSPFLCPPCQTRHLPPGAPGSAGSGQVLHRCAAKCGSLVSASGVQGRPVRSLQPVCWAWACQTVSSSTIEAAVCETQPVGPGDGRLVCGPSSSPRKNPGTGLALGMGDPAGDVAKETWPGRGRASRHAPACPRPSYSPSTALNALGAGPRPRASELSWLGDLG